MTQLLGGLVPKNMAANMPFLDGVGLNLHTCVFAVSAGLVARITTATPILRLTPQRVRAGLVEGGRGSASLFWRRLGSNLVIVELVIAVVLLTGAGLLGEVSTGFCMCPWGSSPATLLRWMSWPRARSTRAIRRSRSSYQETTRRISALPGVQSAGMTSMLPVKCNCAIHGIEVVGVDRIKSTQLTWISAM